MIGLLQQLGSVSAEIFDRLKLGRTPLHEVYGLLAHGREIRVNLSCVPMATRFRFFADGRLRPKARKSG